MLELIGLLLMGSVATLLLVSFLYWTTQSQKRTGGALALNLIFLAAMFAVSIDEGRSELTIVTIVCAVAAVLFTVMMVTADN